MKLKLFIIFYFIFSFASISELIAKLDSGQKYQGYIYLFSVTESPNKFDFTVEKDSGMNIIKLKGNLFLFQLKYRKLEDETYNFNLIKDNLAGTNIDISKPITYLVKDNHIDLYFFSNTIHGYIRIYFNSAEFEVPTNMDSLGLGLLNSYFHIGLTRYEEAQPDTKYYEKRSSLPDGVYKDTYGEYFQVLLRKPHDLELKNPLENLSHYNYQYLDNDTYKKLFNGFTENLQPVIPALENAEQIQKLYTDVMKEEKSSCVDMSLCYHHSLEILGQIKNKGLLPQPVLILLGCPAMHPRCLELPNSHLKMQSHLAILYKAKDDTNTYILDPSVNSEKIITIDEWIKKINREKNANFRIIWKKY